MPFNGHSADDSRFYYSYFARFITSMRSIRFQRGGEISYRPISRHLAAPVNEFMMQARRQPQLDAIAELARKEEKA